MIHILAGACFAASFVFLVIETIGLFRLPDLYSRIQAVGLGDTLGFGLAGAGFLILSPSNALRLKIFLILLLFWFINPTISHLIAKIAYWSGMAPVTDNKEFTARNKVKKHGV